MELVANALTWVRYISNWAASVSVFGGNLGRTAALRQSQQCTDHCFGSLDLFMAIVRRCLAKPIYKRPLPERSLQAPEIAENVGSSFLHERA